MSKRAKSKRLETSTGRCLCGAVTFTAKDVKPRFGVCHCGMCRRWSGSGLFGAQVFGGVEWTGEDNIGRYHASEWGERGFCKTCGSNLFWRTRDGSHMVMAVGLFDDQTSFELVSEIFIDRKPDGYAFAGDHHTMTEAEVLALYTGGDG